MLKVIFWIVIIYIGVVSFISDKKETNNDSYKSTASSHINSTYTIKRNSIGCPTQELLAPASLSISKGGLEAFLPYVNRGCLLMIKGYHGILLDRTFGLVKLNFKSPKGYVVLWTSRETIE